ncbi:hypothetical protein GCM10022216_05690 [Sphingobacterium kyonggiense]|uniref:Uncharacterized protein n=1 Tax=Sphingobacterium kyonggiense TaxID=714075 RepID=A0ABP7YB50_9SPHI
MKFKFKDEVNPKDYQKANHHIGNSNSLPVDNRLQNRGKKCYGRQRNECNGYGGNFYRMKEQNPMQTD